MWDLITALGLVLAVEGILFAAFPNAIRRALYEASQSPPERLRVTGIVCAVIGIAIIWLVRG
ncbi:MAG: DUF2065 domain-containing protein [Salinarimonas sp.]